ncbi:MAG: YciI family protein [Aurantibacter sp.]
MKNFILLLRENAEQIKDLSPEEMQKLVGSHMKYRDDLEKAGKFVAGSGLDQNGRYIVGKDALIKDGPYIEAKELIGGYYVISAEDYNSALEIAKACPNHHWGGTTEVRYMMTAEDYGA